MTVGQRSASRHEVTIRVDEAQLKGDLVVPRGATSIVVFAHGSGSSRRSERNRFVAEMLHHSGFATLLFDLLTPEEEPIDHYTRRLRFDIPLLSSRLTDTVRWVSEQPETKGLRIGLFGASTGAAAALTAAADEPDRVHAVVSRGGRPDLAEGALPRVQAPTLLIVGGEDRDVLELNIQAAARMKVRRRIDVVPYATHLFVEPGALEHVADTARDWFNVYLPNVVRDEP